MYRVYVKKKSTDMVGGDKEELGCATMTWAEFLREFNSKYCSQAVVNSKVAEFTRL